VVTATLAPKLWKCQSLSKAFLASISSSPSAASIAYSIKIRRRGTLTGN
jgi:hypothetical protein